MKKILTRSTLRLSLALALASTALLSFTCAQAENSGQGILDYIYSVVEDSPSSEIPEETQTEPLEEAIGPDTADNAIIEFDDLTPSISEEPTAETLTKGNAAQADISPPAKVAIIIDDMGPDRRRGFDVMSIDAPLTLAFLPYADNLSEMTKIATKQGHELMIHMPMEPENHKLDLGGIGLRNDMSQEEWAEELDKAFASFDGYSGLNNHMGSRLTQNQDAMDYVMSRLVEQGLYFVDSKTISTSVANDSARNAGLRTASRDVFLDHKENIEFVRNALVKLEKTAKRRGHAIAIGHPKNVTIQGLKEWIPTLEDKGIELVHASALVRSYKSEDMPNAASIAQDESTEPTMSTSAEDSEHALKESLKFDSPE